jgi:geranylgeranyl pyrophosphate synthase
MTSQLCKYLSDFIPAFDRFSANTWSLKNSQLHQAISYCVGGGGKKIRAKIAMMVCESYGKPIRLAFPAATSIEMIHAYSLAHDDLPCMDNDDLRRGRPSLHKVFGDATALLAGDALLTDAFRVLSDIEFFPDSGLLSERAKLRSVLELSKAAGSFGMVNGQDLDMTWTGKPNYSIHLLDEIHLGKTGALMGASFAMGAIAAEALESEVKQWRKVGLLTGLAFQAIDDTLDVENETGKSQGKDQAQGKLTYLSYYNVDEIRIMASKYIEEANELVPKSFMADEIKKLTRELVLRKK